MVQAGCAGISHNTRDELMTPPDYVRILKLDKIALKAQSRAKYLEAVKARQPYAKNLGVEKNFAYFVDQAWLMFGNAR